MTTLGKFRHLSRCTTTNGHFVIMAIDHRTNLLTSLNRHASTPLSNAEFVAFKQGVIRALAPQSSAVLTDPAYGIGAGITSGAIGGQIGLLAPVEVTDYDLHPSQRQMDFIPNWSVKKIKMVGGDGVKLLLPYHPDADNVQEKYATVRQIVDDCATYDIPFFLEPIPYSLDPNSTLPNDELLQISVEMCKTFSAMDVDILKLAFPVDHKQSTDGDQWRAACEQVNAACSVPWALLSGGSDYETFARQVEIACQAGGSGVIVGRAVWSEAVELQDTGREMFLAGKAVDRMRQLAEICQENATAWYKQVTRPDADIDWFTDYQS